MENKKPKIIVVAGPTASGKSAIAIRLARKFNGEIISADSRQVYRGMDIGTGKISKRERKLVRHWLIDVASPARQYSVARFKREAQKAIRDIVRRGKLPIICGGTGFWIDALVYDLNLPAVKPDKILRTKLAKLTAEQLFARLKSLDPERAATIDRHNPVRLVRALEIVTTTGRPVPPRINGSLYEPLYLVISVPQNELNRRIKKRLDARFKQGMVAEVTRLHTHGISWKRLESFGLEYRWVARFLQKKISHKDMANELLRDIISYSKRQHTWWRAHTDITPIRGTADAQRSVRRFLKIK